MFYERIIYYCEQNFKIKCFIFLKTQDIVKINIKLSEITIRKGRNMISALDIVKKSLIERGCSQAWVIKRMNDLNPALKMDRSKFSSITTGRRKMSGDELLAFCKAVEVSPDEFLAPDEKEVV